MNWFIKYRDYSISTCVESTQDNTLAYWKDYLFAKSIFYLIPFSLIALIPAIIICIKKELYDILFFDFFAITLLFVLAFVPGISIQQRKTWFCLMVYSIAFVLLNSLGAFGPGLVYLLSASIFMLITFPQRFYLLPFILNVLFCIVYGAIIHFQVFAIHQSLEHNVLEWFAISTNVLFLSAFFTMLLPALFSRMQEALSAQIALKESLNKSNEELSKTLNELKEKNTDLEHFAFVASHDLQEPLRMITSFLAKLELRYRDKLDERANQYLHFATDGATRMKQLILDLLEYSMAGKLNDATESIDLNQLLNKYLDLRKIIIEEKSVKIDTENLPIIKTYKAPLNQVLHCLLDNAIKYSRADVPPEIKIAATDKEGFWLFSIKDNGIGIDREFFDRIFIIFQRLHNRDKYPGTGIGLSIAKRHVESWGGKIWLESEPGNGTTFYFTMNKDS